MAAGSEGLGRLFNVVPVCTAGGAIRLDQGSAITFVVTGATAVPTLTIATSFAGSYQVASFFTPAWAPIKNVYWTLLTTGVNVWNKLALATPAATFTLGTTAGLTTATAAVFTIFGSQIPDTYKYVKCTVTGSGIGMAIVHDLLVQRAPANLPALSA